jgi:hypothetical protein
MIARAAEPALVARTRAPEASGTGPKRNLARSVLVRNRAVHADNSARSGHRRCTQPSHYASHLQ